MNSKVEADVQDQYLISIRLIERLHRRFLDVIKAELDRLGIEDINNVQTLILFNITQNSRPSASSRSVATTWGRMSPTM